MGKYSLGGRCTCQRPVGGTAGPLAQPRTHSLCSLLWRWGLAVSQEQYQAAVHWSQILPRGPGLPPKTVERVPGDRPQAWAGRPDTRVTAAASAGATGAGPLGVHRGLSAGSGVKVRATFVPQRVPAAVPGLRWPSTCALRSSSAYECPGEHRGLSWVHPTPASHPDSSRAFLEHPRPGSKRLGRRTDPRREGNTTSLVATGAPHEA